MRSKWLALPCVGLTLIVGACASSPTATPSVGSSASPGSGPSGSGPANAAPGTVRWVPGAAEQADGDPPSYSAASTCGSDSATYLAELADTSPDQAKVLREWADVVPGGKQILISGTLTSSHLGPQDLPMSHTFGDDLSMNIKLDPQFTRYSKQLGKTEESESATAGTAAPTSRPGGSSTSSTAPSTSSAPSTTAAPPKIDEQDNGHVGEDDAGFMHVEISSGLIPHSIRPANADGQSWRDLSDFNLTGFIPGLKKPAVGDPVVIMGRWIIDCGHGNYGTELHAITFLAWSHQDGDRTVVHFYQNPLRDSEDYSPDASALAKVGDPARLTQPPAKPFPPYFVDEVVRLLQGQTDRLRSQELLDATIASPAEWQVCAPPNTTKVKVSSDVVTRPGTSFRVGEPDATGCVTIHSALEPTYTPAEPKLHTCALPWSFLDQIARGAVPSGDLDVRRIIKSRVPQQYWDLVDRDPVTSCGDALSGPDTNPSPQGNDTRTVADQPFPYYGTITLTAQR